MLPGGSAWQGLEQLMQTLSFARQNCSSLGMIPKGFTYLKERQMLMEFSEFSGVLKALHLPVPGDTEYFYKPCS